MAMTFTRRGIILNRSIGIVRILAFCVLIVSTDAFVSTPNTAPDASSTQLHASAKPILVVGATGRVGRLVVNQLLEQDRPVRALVRNTSKAQELFSTASNQTLPLEIVTADLGHYDDPACAQMLEKAVQGCDCIISVSGTVRFSKLTDFLPWRLFRTNVTSWCEDDRRHPFYPNYMAQALLIDLAAKHNVTTICTIDRLDRGASGL